MKFWQHFSDLDSFPPPTYSSLLFLKRTFPTYYAGSITLLEHHTQSFCAIIAFKAIPFTYTVVIENDSLGRIPIGHMTYFLFPIYFYALGYAHFNNVRYKTYHNIILLCEPVDTTEILLLTKGS